MSEATAIKETVGSGKVRALVAEDTPAISEILKLTFEIAGGFDTQFTEDTSSALSILRKAKEMGQPIELIFSDLGLKDDPLGGFTLAEAMRTEGLAKAFVLFTGSAEGPDVKEKANALQIRLLAKPAPPSIIKPLLEEIKTTIKSS